MKSELTIDKNSTKWWKLPNGDFHKEDKPAIETVSGNKTWCMNGLRHREDGPAVENFGGGDKEWWVNGDRHREDGPAVEFGNGSKYWYLNNIQYSEKEYKSKMRSIILSKLFK
jgi:hypothetical protein